jgi:hypothetical protein
LESKNRVSVIRYLFFVYFLHKPPAASTVDINTIICYADTPTSTAFFLKYKEKIKKSLNARMFHVACDVIKKK